MTSEVWVRQMWLRDMELSNGGAMKVKIVHLPNTTGAPAWSINVPDVGEPLPEEVLLIGWELRIYPDEEAERVISPVVAPDFGLLVVGLGRNRFLDVDSKLQVYPSLPDAAEAVAKRVRQRSEKGL